MFQPNWHNFRDIEPIICIFFNLHTKKSVKPDPKYISYIASYLNSNPSYNDHTLSKPKYDHTQFNIHSIPLRFYCPEMVLIS